jgi:hypothetical protein
MKKKIVYYYYKILAPVSKLNGKKWSKDRDDMFMF